MPKVAFTTLGCKVNQYDTEVMHGLFWQAGYEIVDFSQQADVYIINTCSVTHLGERKSRQLIRRAVRQNPEAVVAVTGCYAQTAAEEVLAIPGVSLTVGNQQRGQIVTLVEEVSMTRKSVNAVHDIMTANTFEDIQVSESQDRTRAFLKIQEGCTNFCSYCIIPYARGPLRSRQPASVVQETQRLVKQGFKEIVLTGIHLGAYGRDLGNIDIADICASMLEVEGLQRLRLSSIEITEVTPKLIELIASHSVMCRHLHLPLQSGSDSVLKRMNRHYTTGEYAEKCQEFLAAVPNLAITSDLIVGFPGETDAEFLQTKQFIGSLDLLRIHVFPYSKRSGTPAASMPGQVLSAVKHQRVTEILSLSEQKEAEFSQRFIGSTLAVLFEDYSDGILSGLSDNYLHVKAKGNAANYRNMCTIQITGIDNGKLIGDIVEE